METEDCGERFALVRSGGGGLGVGGEDFGGGFEFRGGAWGDEVGEGVLGLRHGWSAIGRGLVQRSGRKSLLGNIFAGVKMVVRLGRRLGRCSLWRGTQRMVEEIGT